MRGRKRHIQSQREIKFNDHLILAYMPNTDSGGYLWYWWNVDRFTGEVVVDEANQEYAERYAMGLK